MTTVHFDPLAQRYPSQRYPIYANRAMVNCSEPQASAAGLQAILKGGNAFDAAVAAAAALTVVEPTSNGLGSDAFCIAWSAREQRLIGLNSSGPAPQGISIDRVFADGNATAGGRMPRFGWTPVTVPGAPAAWAALNARNGRLTLSDDLAPAVDYARNGYAANPNLAYWWKRSADAYRRENVGGRFDDWFSTFTRGDDRRTPRAGDVVTLPDHADSLAEIGATNARSFYEGDLARAIDAASRASGGYLRYDDLAAYAPRWVDPMRLDYRDGWQVCEIPPNGQGIVALMALNILRNFDIAGTDRALTYHRQIEAIKLAFADAFDVVTDPDDTSVDYARYLAPEYGEEKARLIGETAQVRTTRTPSTSGTVYLCCADCEGNMVSYIQSNYMGFGSGIVVPGTGIAVQNRGADFALDPSLANALKPGKRTYHTIIPGFLMRDGRPVGPFGVMGAYMQPQGHVQVAMNAIDFGMDPQQALDAPRWRWDRGNATRVETRFDAAIARELARRGHEMSMSLETADFGRGQMIMRVGDWDGTADRAAGDAAGSGWGGRSLVGGTESRTDSNIACL
ncbi:gamma-glutamyltransferase family protein [Bifidobacterium sp. 82T10]|uniref:Gamma-glutamyltransferase family protein n=1 Tax=Bifidobacterium miconis TaxID=2834435 RepID=A0ABS6WHG8_9BIFI|nr:gamma-glutamyltransferase family protein [Bifidobacterium miconis]MBW3093494.1 gamma-glutamyltransferase family protein [Bifidobacterium miconis]